jgi:hypothetical protein
LWICPSDSHPSGGLPVSDCEFRKTTLHLAPQAISCRPKNHVTILRTRHSGIRRRRMSGIQETTMTSCGVWFPASRGHCLDPGSRPVLRDLAGMTDCDLVSLGKRAHVVVLRSYIHRRFRKTPLCFYPTSSASNAITLPFILVRKRRKTSGTKFA